MKRTRQTLCAELERQANATCFTPSFQFSCIISDKNLNDFTQESRVTDSTNVDSSPNCDLPNKNINNRNITKQLAQPICNGQYESQKTKDCNKNSSDTENLNLALNEKMEQNSEGNHVQTMNLGSAGSERKSRGEFG